jgi:glucose repression regulatory protein TUP1
MNAHGLALNDPASSSVLLHESAGKADDSYIRSVCFSPDGKLLATGAEDHQIRVRLSTPFC